MNVAIASGDEFVWTMKSTGPIFWSPAGSTMFCPASALPTSEADSPYCSSFSRSRSTCTFAAVPP